MSLKVGIIPEHFSTPLRFASEKGFFKNNGLDVELIEYPSGSGHLIQSLQKNEIDIAIGLTEAFVRGLCDGEDSYYISGTYVESPLCWAISTGSQRDDLNSKDQLQGMKIGVSRIGSGSYVMSFVLALQENFKKSYDAGYFEKFPILNNFKNLRDSVNAVDGVEASDAFMWEHFTSKKYYDNLEIKKIGEIYTPWSSWVIVPHRNLDKSTISKFSNAVQQGIQYYLENKQEAANYIANNLDYSLQDAKEWQNTVIFSNDVSKIDVEKNIQNTKKILKTAGVIQTNGESDLLIQERLNAGVLNLK
ncbi:hypothetical protein CANARDRAFT_193622 [[Candida] arabinofermentans NRRL YB-2248]|uniref:Ca3427-like PBP 2 domain-containing protein n=1 Tax=[Candida] arabinofermentans NRRL YB-2248 TaxID=983967 RepID=A0A1E4T8W7_9ASCO|nr:hypothetical protein CANARDRAFT_193622 [[Candida] arabinofermentans NRRL YB-2248]